MLGPGDELIVLVTGLNESSAHSKVSAEGNLQIHYVGIVYVNGITIERATSLIRARAAFLLDPKYNLRIEARLTLRRETNAQFTNNTALISFGLLSSFRNLYYDF